MDYKEKFEDFLDRMAGLLDEANKKGHIIVRVEDLENAFPELKETDKKIKEALIELVKCKERSGYLIVNNVSTRSMKSWIEKQGEQDVRYKHLEELLVADDIYQMSINQDMVEEAKTKAINALSKLCISELLLEKQGEKKPNYCHHEMNLSDCSEEYRKAYYDGWNNCNMQHSQCRSELDDVVKCLINGMKFYYEDNKEATWGTDKWSMPVKHIIEVLEKHSTKPKEFTLAYEAEVGNGNIKGLVTKKLQLSKFHEGDWVVDSMGITHKIERVIENITYNTFGYDIVGGGYFNDDPDVHLWTVADAKDGDVLNSPTHNLIWIYKDNEHYHVCANMNYVTENVATDGLISIPNDACPATKDEQTILFTKMHEAGYEWDTEKKELKKVESF